MRCAIGADDVGPLTDALLAELERRGVAAERFGSLRTGGDGDEPRDEPGDRSSIEMVEALNPR